MSRLLLVSLLAGCAQLYGSPRPAETREQQIIDLARELYDADPLMPERRRRCRDRELRIAYLPIEEIERQCVLTFQYDRFGSISCLGQQGNWRLEVMLISEGHARPEAAIGHETIHDALRCAQVGADAYHTYAPAWGPDGLDKRIESML